MSSVVDTDDRATAVLFGDGAGVVLVEPAEDESVILDQVCWMDGEGNQPATYRPAARPASHRGISEPATTYVVRRGRSVRAAVGAWPR
jgi:3-oxoacyl-[acyl-carrier-protein] synthase-3